MSSEDLGIHVVLDELPAGMGESVLKVRNTQEIALQAEEWNTDRPDAKVLALSRHHKK